MAETDKQRKNRIRRDTRASNVALATMLATFVVAFSATTTEGSTIGPVLLLASPTVGLLAGWIAAKL